MLLFISYFIFNPLSALAALSCKVQTSGPTWQIILKQILILNVMSAIGKKLPRGGSKRIVNLFLIHTILLQTTHTQSNNSYRPHTRTKVRHTQQAAASLDIPPPPHISQRIRRSIVSPHQPPPHLQWRHD